ncbi:MAG: hypothetical protein R3D51_00045 [Hyphomicrobiaceae bacterium]
MPQTANSYLAQLLSDGTDGSFDSTQSSIQAVFWDAKSSGATAFLSNNESRRDIELPGNAAIFCSAGGNVVVEFQTRIQSEAGISERQVITLVFSSAMDRSLVLRRTISHRGIGPLFLPASGTDVTYMRFERL